MIVRYELYHIILDERGDCSLFMALKETYDTIFWINVVVSKNLQLFETCRGKLFSNMFLSHFRKLIYFLGETRLHIKFTAKKELKKS